MPNLFTRFALGLRLFVICMVTASVSLPMAWVSLGKLLLFVGCLVSYLFGLRRHASDEASAHALSRLWTVRIILLVVASFGLSLGWTQAPLDVAVMAFAKHSKLLEIAMLVMLIRNAREARLALLVFGLSQAFFILSSWIMAMGYRVPWATSILTPQYKNVVYSTYLDQTLMFAAVAGVCWHMRSYWPKAPWLGAALAVLAVVNNLFLQVGKTGYVATLVVLTLAVMWQIRPKWRVATVLVFPALLGLMYASSSPFHDKVNQVITESQSYNTQSDALSSSGFRLHAWRRSVQAMAEQPFTGTGVGSWTQTVKRIEGVNANQIFGDGLTSNPHQEFLLWGVALGVGGTLLLLSLLVALVRDALQFKPPLQRALISVVAVMTVGCLFNSSLYDALIGDFFCVTLGLLLAVGVRCDPAEPASTHRHLTGHTV